jgi:hypothetical protein
LSARAVIKKGSLSLIHKPTIAGHLAYVLDENKKICLGSTENENSTGIHFDGNFYPAKPDRGGKIFIPYGKSTLNAKAILINNGFAQLCDFERQTERYSFSAWMHLNSESCYPYWKQSIPPDQASTPGELETSFPVSFEEGQGHPDYDLLYRQPTGDQEL